MDKPTATTTLTREEHPPTTDRVAVFGPASLSNLGPGFDTLGLCLSGLGDVVEAWLTDEPGVQVVIGEGTVEAPTPTDPAKNTAARAASVVLAQAEASQGLVLCIR